MARVALTDDNGTFYGAVRAGVENVVGAPRPLSVPGTTPIPGGYNPLTQTYNVRAGQLRNTRKKLARILNGQTDRLKILAVGDSNTEGDGAIKHQTAWPAHLHKLIAGAGVADAGSGLVFMRTDGRWARADWVAQGASKHGYRSASTAAATFTSDRAGTAVDYWYDATSPAHKITVDGIEHTPPTGTERIRKFTVTGLSNTKHVVSIVPNGAGVIAYGVELYQTKGASVTNAGISGTSTANWLPSVADADAAFKTAAAWAPDLVYVNLGTNDQGGGITIAAYTDNLRAILTGFTGADVVFGTPVPRDADLSSYIAAEYALADELGLRLLDLNDRWHPYADAYAAGYYSDTLHGNWWSYLDLARAVAGLLDLPTGTLAPAVAADAPAPPNPATVYAADTFNRADGPLGTAETGGTWVTGNGTWGIVGNVAKASAITNAAGTYAVLDTGQADGVFSTVVAGGTWGMGLTIGLDVATGASVVVYAESGSVSVETRTGWLTGEKQQFGNTFAGGETLTVEKSGSNFTIKVNGATRGTFTATTTGTAHGLFSNNTSRTLDNYKHTNK